jgi:hypothetical protein
LQSVAELPVAIEPELPSPPASVAEVVPERVEGGAAGAPTVAAAEEVEPMSTTSPSLAASETSVQTLDFSSLAKRLRKTRAIDLLTKVAVKNESDDLLERFRAYHAQAGTATLADLRRSYDSLFLKLHALLEDADPPLAREIDRSRAAIWEYLADPRKFGSSQLMAGA